MKLNPKLIEITIESFRKKEIELENLKNLRTGQICATVVNVNRRRGKRYKATDFIKPIKAKEKQTPEQMAKVLEKITNLLGGNIIA